MLIQTGDDLCWRRCHSLRQRHRLKFHCAFTWNTKYTVFNIFTNLLTTLIVPNIQKPMPKPFHSMRQEASFALPHIGHLKSDWVCVCRTAIKDCWGARNGAVVRALPSNQCGPGSNPGVDAICGLSLLLVLSLAPRGFFRVLQFSPVLKNQHFQIPIRPGIR